MAFTLALRSHSSPPQPRLSPRAPTAPTHPSPAFDAGGAAVFAITDTPTGNLLGATDLHLEPEDGRRLDLVVHAALREEWTAG